MTRPLRIEYPGAWYHVMNRGRRFEKIFTGCLMSNHYHILLQAPEGNISRTMRQLQIDKDLRKRIGELTLMIDKSQKQT